MEHKHWIHETKLIPTHNDKVYMSKTQVLKTHTHTQGKRRMEKPNKKRCHIGTITSLKVTHVNAKVTNMSKIKQSPWIRKEHKKRNTLGVSELA